jgi:hypothetical protein
MLRDLNTRLLPLKSNLTCRAHQTGRFVALLPCCSVGKLIAANTSSRIIKSMAQPCTHILLLAIPCLPWACRLLLPLRLCLQVNSKWNYRTRHGPYLPFRSKHFRGGSEGTAAHDLTVKRCHRYVTNDMHKVLKAIRACPMVDKTSFILTRHII